MRDANIPQPIGAANAEMEVARLLEIGHCRVERIVGSFQVAICPIGEAQEGSGWTAAQVVVGGQEIKRGLPILERCRRLPWAWAM